MLVPALVLAADTVAAFMGPGVSRQLAEHRARTISEVRYDLALDVTPLDSALGQVTVRFRRTGPGDLVVDFRGRHLTAAAANGQALPEGAFNGAHLRVPARLLRSGENRLDFRFVSAVAPSGASIIRFRDRADSSDYLYTLLVPADANQLFPSFDQPDLKARVTFRLTTSAGWSAVSNGALARADTAGGRVTHHFTETRPISTYLIAFAAGPWHRASMTSGGRPMTVYVRRSRAREADLDTLLAANHRAIDWMERYFDRPYPFEKYDFVLAPAFPFGGMEHPGAVFYNEDGFIFRERPTLPRRLGRLSTVLHEVAHMWFGDLVTMRWFDDLWLKEGFATYIAAKALTDLDSTSGAWQTFYLRNKPAAYGVDQTRGTTPVWQELGNLDQAKSNYGPIVYNKAPSVLKQLNYLVGETAFQNGVRDFLERHAYANATWRDLLAAIGSAGGRSLDDWGRQFILRPGMPEVEPRLELRDGRIARLTLRQRPVQRLSGPGPWPMRTQVLVGWAGREPVLIPVGMAADETSVPEAAGLPAPHLLFANAGDYGYHLTRLDSATTRWLLAGGITRVEDRFLRAMLWGSLWDEVRNGRLPPGEFVGLGLTALPAETDEQIAPSLLGRLQRAMGAYLGRAERAEVQETAEQTLVRMADDTTRAYGIRKAALDAFIETASTPAALARLAALLSVDSAAGEPVRDPTRWAVVGRMLVLGHPGAEAALERQRVRDTTPDGRRRAFIAGAGRPRAETKREYFTRWFADSTLNEEWASGSLGSFNALAHEDLTRPYLQAALDSLAFIQANRRIFFLGNWLDAFLGGQTSPEALQVVTAWLDRHPDLPADLRRKVLQYADELERTVAIRRNAAR
ncbi:MAG TPA: M1 family aminopeptidase [Gemmatimonadales bacterium]